MLDILGLLETFPNELRLKNPLYTLNASSFVCFVFLAFFFSMGIISGVAVIEAGLGVVFNIH